MHAGRNVRHRDSLKWKKGESRTLLQNFPPSPSRDLVCISPSSQQTCSLSHVPHLRRFASYFPFTLFQFCLRVRVHCPIKRVAIHLISQFSTYQPHAPARPTTTRLHFVHNYTTRTFVFSFLFYAFKLHDSTSYFNKDCFRK